MRLYEVTTQEPLLKQWFINVLEIGIVKGSIGFILDLIIAIVIITPIHFIIACLQLTIFDRITIESLENKLFKAKKQYLKFKSNNEYIPGKRVTYQEYSLFCYRSAYKELDHFKRKHNKRTLFLLPGNGLVFPILELLSSLSKDSYYKEDVGESFV